MNMISFIFVNWTMIFLMIKFYEIFHVKTPEKLVYSAHYFWQLIGIVRAF